MNNPLIALVIALAMFVWLWSTEHDNRAAHRADRVAQSIRQAETKTAAAEPAREIPLPEGITPGLYMVMDGKGKQRWIEVTVEQIQAAELTQPMVERDYYVAVSGNRHWIYENVGAIRLASKLSMMAAHPADATRKKDRWRASAGKTPTAKKSGPTAEQWQAWFGDICEQAQTSWWEKPAAATTDANDAEIGEPHIGEKRSVKSADRLWWRIMRLETEVNEIASPPSEGRSL